MKPFDKTPLSIPEQLQLLKDRGLSINDDERAKCFLEVASLFRLSPYMRPFQHTGNPGHSFHEGATLRQIVNIYRFDSRLRNLVMEAIERVEVATRAGITNHMSPHYGAHWYQEPQNFKRGYDHRRLIDEITKKQKDEQKHFQREVQRIEKSRATDEQKAQRIEHRKRDNYYRYYTHTYNQPQLPPSWAILEELSLGALSRVYKNIAKDSDRKQIASRFKLPQDVLGSWLHTLTFIRNCCAHHSRLWNRELSVKPSLPRAKEWALPNVLANQPRPENRLFVVLLMLAYMMKNISPDNHWQQRLVDLLEEYPATPLTAMGFVENWQEHPIWKGLG